ncbi:MAG: hypothetical protein A2Z72_04060 [Omnitrophica bacterium RBG_13_46_9]|nr:MAG: hypothetical protein A2Z72_04060 [Omnitrophica bacterium RBG_13_46_9]
MIRFTKEEKIAVIFLLACLFTGTVVLYYKTLNPASGIFVGPDGGWIEGSKRININTASGEELILIKGIGPVLAERIVSYREKHGSFKRPEDIRNVKGLGGGTYDKIKKQITLE